MHRLDRDTSGLMAAARTEDAYERLSQLVRERALERTYLALVEGRPRSRRGGSTPRSAATATIRRASRSTASRPRDAVTHFEVEQLFDRHALLRVQLETGRMHQIRSTWPRSICRWSAIPSTAAAPRARAPVPARGELAFPHPITGARIELSSALPADLESYLVLNQHKL